MSGLIMLFIHSPEAGSRQLSVLVPLRFSLLPLHPAAQSGVLGGHPALGIRVGGLVSLMSILLLLAGFVRFTNAHGIPVPWGGVAVLLLLYLGLSSLAPCALCWL